MDARMRTGWVHITALLFLFVLAGCEAPDASGGAQTLGRWQPQRSASDKDDIEVARTPDIQANTHLAAGRLHESQNYLNKAVGQYRACLALDPSCAEAHERLGLCLGRLGNFDEAETHFRQAIALEPNKAHHRNNIAFCYMSRGRWSDAEAELRNAVELRPAFVRARINLGIVLAQQNRFDEALSAFRVVLTEADAQYNIGLMYQSARRFVEASDAYKASLAANPKLVAATQRLEEVQPLAEQAAAAAAAAAEAEALAQAQRDEAAAAAAAQRIAELAPEAEAMLARVLETLAEATAVGAEMREQAAAPKPEQILVTISAETPASPIAVLDASDDMWLAGLNPMTRRMDMYSVDAMETGSVGQEGGLPFRIELSPAAPEAAVPEIAAVSPRAAEAVVADEYLDAIFGAGAPFLAGPAALGWASLLSPYPEIVPIAVQADFDLPWTVVTMDGPHLAFPR